MNSHSPSSGAGPGRGEGARTSKAGALPYMSARQTEAYLLARETIRRIQRTASIVSSLSKDASRDPPSAERRRNSH